MSSDSSKSDRARWLVPIVVALITAIAAVIAAVAPSLLSSNGGPSTDQPTVSNPPTAHFEYQGIATIRGANPEIDLDSLPDGTGGDHVADLVHTAAALTTSKHSLLALLDRAQPPTPDTCRSELAAHSISMIAASQLETGLSLCIRTTAGRTGVVTLDLVRHYSERQLLGQVALSYRIWNLTAN